MPQNTFLDEAEIEVRSGKGGDGMMHFRREKYEARGGPDGGDGGKGGSVIFKVDPNLRTLFSLRNKKHLFAEDGRPGGPSQRTGKSAPDLIVAVPPGTLIYESTSNDLLADLTQPDQQVVVCQGGRGGRGNIHFANSRNRAPRMAEKGEPPEEKKIRLELKLIADVGIVGVPNAGKSTFLAQVSNAKPKIANYPFTTLSPNLGVAALDEDTTLVLADIPGLIEGASQGLGLGHDFLRHVQRTRVLIHLLDGMSEDPLVDYAQIQTELALFDPDLAKKAQILVLNKMDLHEVEDKFDVLREHFAQQDIELIGMSGISGENSRRVLGLAHEALQSSPVDIVQEVPIYRPELDPRLFTVEKEADGWRLKGESIERAAAMTYWDLDQSVRRFQRILERLGVNEALKEKGVEAGESVFIGDHELEWNE